MTYPRRIAVALLLSLLVHLAFAGRFASVPPVTLAKYPEPLVLEMPPRTPEQPRRLVETQQEAQEPASETDNISDKNAKAQDLSDVVGEKPAPFLENQSDVDQTAVVTSPPVPPQPKPAPAPPAPKPEPKPASQKADASTAATAADGPEKRDEAPEEPLKVAQRTAPESPEPAPPESEPPRPASARAGGGVETRGIAGFEAHKDQLAPYLLEVRKRVERNWRAALELRYSGTEPTKAVIDCAIRPDGTLAYVSIVDPGQSVSFGALCKSSVEKAGPFAPFPFEVPEIYRNKNLEIRWTFSYM